MPFSTLSTRACLCSCVCLCVYTCMFLSVCGHMCERVCVLRAYMATAIVGSDARAMSEKPHLCGPPLLPQRTGTVSLTRKRKGDISGLGPTREPPFTGRKLMAPKAYREPTVPSPALSSSPTPGTPASLGSPDNAGPTHPRALPPALCRPGPAVCP